MKKRSLKQRLVAATLALVMLLSSLLGTTFAWFTDSVTSGGNKIQSGNLEIDLLHKVNSGWVSLKEHTDHKVFDYDKWEPGYTRVESLKVANLGSLALKYKLSLEAAVGTATVGKNGEKLSDVIDVYILGEDSNGTSFETIKNSWVYKGTLTQVLKNPANFFSGELLPTGEDSSTVAVGNKIVSIALHMQEEAGNEYQKLSVGDIYVNLIATQSSYENDSFDDKYDEDAIFPELNIGGLSIPVSTLDGKTINGTELIGNGVGAIIPAGVAVEDGVDKLVLSVSEKEKSDANLTLNDDEVLRPLNVHMEGVSESNTMPMTIKIKKAMAAGLNIGNYKLFHVENGVSNQMTAVNSLSELDAHNEYYYDPATGDVTLAMATFSEVALVAEQPKWEGNRDYSWYDASKTEFTIANSDQLAGLSAIVGGMDGQTQDSFKGKTIKLIADINIGDTDSENGYVFYPVGYWNSEGTYEKNTAEATEALSSGFYTFEGTFDGNGHTIANFYQNTWEMKGDHNWYDPIKEQYYRDGMGLFGKVYGGTVKNLTVKNFSSDGEITTTGTIAAYADCGATFENIAIFNCNPRVYNIGNGGIVGCVGWYANDEHTAPVTFKNITVDNTNKISALWGSWDVACGGLVGQYYPTSGQSNAIENGGIYMENCHIAPQIDVYNDVCANYQYYAYRYAGILIGSVRENITVDGHVYPKMDGIEAKDCTVHYGDWNDYYYCEIVANSLASYTHDHQMSRLTQVASVDVANKTVVTLDGETKDISTSGWAHYVVVKSKDANGKWIHGDGAEYATCYHFNNGEVWNHADAGTETVDGVEVLKEDKQLIYREFNNLVTGYGWGVTSKGVGDMEGVTILDREEGASVEKFTSSHPSVIKTDLTYKLGDLFDYVNNGVALKLDQLMVSVSDVDSTDGIVTGTYTPTTTGNWEDATISLTGTGIITITIQDYYFCTPTTITLAVYREIDSISCTLNEDSSLNEVYAHIGDNKVEVTEYDTEKRYGANIVRVRAIYCGGKLYYDSSYPLLETIACSKHVVISEITKQPTLTEQGTIVYTCAGCGYYYTETIDKWTTAEATQGKYYKEYLYKDLILNGERKILLAEKDEKISEITYVDVSDGTQDLALFGWLGGIESEIVGFGYYLGNNYYDTYFSDGHSIGTDQAVIDQGGAFAERYIITADIREFQDDASRDVEKVTYVALLADNTLVTIWDVYVCKGNAIVDGEIKASADEMPYYIGGATQNAEGNTYAYQTTTGVNFNVEGNYTYNEPYGGFQGASVLDFDIDPNATQAQINKYKISYYSSQPMKATVTYTLNGAAYNDVVYLESGKHLFSCLVPGYLNRYYATNISAIKVESITGAAADFILYDVSGESIDVYGDAAYTYYFENANYRMGITLDMGGAIGYLEDLQDGNGSLTNLINRADTGRLVQQSYYGYFYNDENIVMSGAKWSYNPVQGGNKPQDTKGRLIDIEVKDNSVYIKAQPADWAVTGNNAWTPCYMENVYSIYEGTDARVEVYNSYVDFSTYVHPVKSQELPAFYTVSHLGSFMYYDMSGNRVDIHDLPDWANNPNGYFSINSDKSWCAWYNGNYGVGLYAPNTDVLYAGRHEYNDSADASDPATNYVAPLTDFKLELDKKFEYSYMITTGSVDEINATFTKYQNFDENKMLDGANAVHGACIDNWSVNSDVYTVGGPTCDITFNVKQGDTLGMTGWIGYRNVGITDFCYYVGDDSSNHVIVPAIEDANVQAQTAGGPFAKRFIFSNIDTSETPAGTHKLTLAAILTNGEIEPIAEWTVIVAENKVYGSYVDAYSVGAEEIPCGLPVCNKSIYDVTAGTTLTMRGWIGFRNLEISQFGYYFNGNTSDATYFEAMSADDAVSLGGPNVKRYNFTVDTTGLTNGIYTLTYAAFLTNGDIMPISEWKVGIGVPKPIANVIILSGQSNAYGASPITSEMKNAYGTPGAFPNVYIRYNNINNQNGQWKVLFQNDAIGFEPYYVGMGAEDPIHFGPEFGIAQWLSENRPDEEWFIIKYTAAGTLLNGQWMTGYTGAIDNYELTTDLGDSLSNLMINFVNGSINSLSENYNVKVHSFMWMQGESDSLYETCAANYQTIEQDFVNKVRGEFAQYTDSGNGEDISFINGGISANKTELANYGNKWTYSDTVNTGKFANCTWWYVPANTSTNVLYRASGDANFLNAGIFYHGNGAIANSMWIDTSTLLSKYEYNNENNENDGAHYCSVSMHQLGTWFAQAMISRMSTTVNCDHAKYTFADTGEVVCGSCGETLVAPDTYVAGEALWNSRDTNYTKNAASSANGAIMTGAGDANGSVALSVSTLPTNQIQKYVVIRYRTNSAEMALASYNPAMVSYYTVSNGEWTIALIELDGACTANRLDIRCNINGNAESYTEISHLASFADLAKAEEYINYMYLLNTGYCYSHPELETGYEGSTVIGQVRCTKCGYVSTPTTYQADADLYDAVVTGNSDNVTDSGAGIAVGNTNRTGNAYSGQGDTVRVQLTSETTYGKYIVVVYNSTYAGGYLALGNGDNSEPSKNFAAGMTATASYRAFCYPRTTFEGNTLDLLLHFGDTEATTVTNIIGVVTFDTLDAARAFAEYTNNELGAN